MLMLEQYQQGSPPEATVITPLLRDRAHPRRFSLGEFLRSEVDPEHATGPLVVFCFMTGFIDVIAFTAVFVWCGFQTGNFAQIALACARLIAGPASFVLHAADRQAITSLVAFNAGALLGRIGDRIGARTRLWLVAGTLAQALLLLIAAVCVQISGEADVATNRGTPSWTGGWTATAVALMAASLGVQGIMGKRLNTHLSTTVVLTTLWIELVTDPQLFRLRKVPSRDRRVTGLLWLFLGAVTGRTMLDWIGSPASLAFGCLLRMVVAGAWCLVPGPKHQDTIDEEGNAGQGGAH